MSYDRLLLKRMNMAYVQGRLRSCVPKDRYRTLDIAIAYASKVNHAGELPYKLVPYPCPFCGNFHLGRNHDDHLSKYEMEVPEEIQNDLMMALDERKKALAK